MGWGDRSLFSRISESNHPEEGPSRGIQGIPPSHYTASQPDPMVFSRALLAVVASSAAVCTSAFSLLPSHVPREASQPATIMSLASRREALSLVVGAGLALAQPAIAADTETPKIPASEMIKPPETSCAQVFPVREPS